jgi:hypothetical protein
MLGYEHPKRERLPNGSDPGIVHCEHTNRPVEIEMSVELSKHLSTHGITYPTKKLNKMASAWA